MSKEKKVKAISDLFAAIAKLGLNFAENQIEKKIENDMAQRGALMFLQPTRDIVVALNDGDAANAAQVKGIILAWVNNDLTEYLQDLTDAGIEKIKGEAEQALLRFGANLVIDMLSILSDDEAENERQIQEYFQDILGSDEFRELIVNVVLASILKKSGASDALQKIVLEAAEIALQALDKKD